MHNPNEFWADWDTEPNARSIVEGPVWSIAHMSDDELKEELVADVILLLAGGIGGILWTDLFRFIRTPASSDRVLNALVELLQNGLLMEDGPYVHVNQSCREALQFTMDYCGRWLDGFNPPEGTELLQLTAEGRALFEANGVEAVAAFCISELERGNVKGNTTKH